MPSSYRQGRAGSRRARRSGRAREPIRRPVPSYARTSSSRTASSSEAMASVTSMKSRAPDRKVISSDLKKVGVITALMVAIVVILSRVL